jgi:hypothetical protein
VRDSLWCNTASSKYLPETRIGSLTGIIFSCIVHVLMDLFYLEFSSFCLYSANISRQKFDNFF